MVVSYRNINFTPARARPPVAPSTSIWTDGDDTMLAISAALQEILPETSIVNTAAAGATSADIRTRMLALDNNRYRPRTAILWDSVQNGLLNFSSYVGAIDDAVFWLGHDYFLVLPPINPSGETYAGSEQASIAIEMANRWPDNFLHWTGFLTNTNGEIDASMFDDPENDAYTLSQEAVDLAATGVFYALLSKGWLDPDVIAPPEGEILLTDDDNTILEDDDGTYLTEDL